jgi:hypothetical protein
MALSLLDPTLASLLGGNDFFPDFSSDTGRTERQNVRGIPLDLIEVCAVTCHHWMQNVRGIPLELCEVFAVTCIQWIMY